MPRPNRVSSFPQRLSPDPPLSSSREERIDIAFPARLIFSRTKATDETIPCILVNVSASGCQILTDRRFSLLLPPTSSTPLEIEFFLNELEIRHVPIQVVRTKKIGTYQLLLGCKFLDLPAAARLALRADVAKRRSESRK